MTPELPLAAAQRRLGKPGRPRKHPENGHDAGHVENGAAQPREIAPQNGAENGACVRPTPAADGETPLRAIVSVAPALLGLEDARRYLGGLSARTVTEYVDAGLLRPVPLPSRRPGKTSRRVVFSRADLDALVARWRGRG